MVLGEAGVQGVVESLAAEAIGLEDAVEEVIEEETLAMVERKERKILHPSSLPLDRIIKKVPGDRNILSPGHRIVKMRRWEEKILFKVISFKKNILLLMDTTMINIILYINQMNQVWTIPYSKALSLNHQMKSSMKKASIATLMPTTTVTFYLPCLQMYSRSLQYQSLVDRIHMR
jgi:hypothetical protein